MAEQTTVVRHHTRPNTPEMDVYQILHIVAVLLPSPSWMALRYQYTSPFVRAQASWTVATNQCISGYQTASEIGALTIPKPMWFRTSQRTSLSTMEKQHRRNKPRTMLVMFAFESRDFAAGVGRTIPLVVSQY